jgi:hypothetical protein
VGAPSGAEKTTPGETLRFIPSSVLDRSARACRILSSSTERVRPIPRLGRACRVGNVLFAQLASYSASNIECAIELEPTKVLRKQHRLQLCVELMTRPLGAIGHNNPLSVACRFTDFGLPRTVEDAPQSTPPTAKPARHCDMRQRPAGLWEDRQAQVVAEYSPAVIQKWSISG